MRVFGYMRFSCVGQRDARASRTGQPIEEVAKAHYRPRRMERRGFLFERPCLKSVVAQQDQNCRLDDYAIGQNMTDRLEAATALAPLERIVTYPSGMYLSHQEGESCLLREYFPNIGIGMAFLNMPAQIKNPDQCQHVVVSRSTKFRKMLAAGHDRGEPGNLRRFRMGLRQEFPGVTIKTPKALVAETSTK